MPEFALLFRSTRTLDAESLLRRNDAARQWAIGLRTGGMLRTASPLEDHGVTVSQKDVSSVIPERVVLSVLTVQASDLDAVISLAQGHPGLAFGTEIEIRPIKPVVTPP